MKLTRMKLLKNAWSVVTIFMTADTGMFKGIWIPRMRVFIIEQILCGAAVKANVCSWWASLWWVTLDWTGTTHGFRNVPVQSQLLNCLCAARKSCFHMCFMFLTTSPKLWNVNLCNIIEFIGEVSNCALLHSVLKPPFCLGARSPTVVHTLWVSPSIQSVSGQWITYAISVFCLSVWNSHICCNRGAWGCPGIRSTV